MDARRKIPKQELRRLCAVSGLELGPDLPLLGRQDLVKSLFVRVVEIAVL